MSETTLTKPPIEAMMTVVIADDVLESRRSTRLMMTLVDDARVVALAHDGREAVEMVRLHRPDVVLMDLNMPNMNGLQAIELIRRHQPRTNCVVLSAERSEDVVVKAERLGVHEYLIKPFTSDQLLGVMNRMRCKIAEQPSREAQSQQEQAARRAELETLAERYIRQRQTNVRAMAVFEELSADPACDMRYLRTLAIIYVFRQHWRRLKLLARHIEKQTKIA